MRSIERMTRWGEANPGLFGIAMGWALFVLSVPVRMALGQGFVNAIYEAGLYAFFWASLMAVAYSWRARRRSRGSD